MSDEEAQRYLEYDLENSKKVTKYYRVEENTNGSTNIEVSEDEYHNAENGIVCYSGDASYTTAYKYILLSSSPGSSNHFIVSLTTVWLITPYMKSYDVNGIRGYEAVPVEGTQSGVQLYATSSNGPYSKVNYAHDGTNIVKKSNGFGISMNLVDAANYFETEIDALFKANSKYAEVFGTYQHAIVNVTLAESRNYNISHNGLGKVINFYDNNESYYDQMQGVSLMLDYKA